MKRRILAAALAVCLLLAVPAAAAPAKSSYPDVPEGDWSIESIENVISGIQNSTDSFVDGMSAICQQIERVEAAADENAQGMERIIDKIGKTTKSAETISGVTKDNQKNAEEIRDIVKKFTK